MSLKDDDANPTVVYIPQVVKRPKKLRTLLESEYKMDTTLGISARAAELFDFLARKAPYQLCDAALAFQVVMGMGRRPRENSEEVMTFRGRSTTIREILGKTYGRGFVVEKPFGLMRATVDDEDLATTQQAREVERIRSAVGAAKRTNDLIDVAKIRDPAVRGWLKGGVSPLLKSLREDDRIFKLLPHKPKKGE